MSLITTPSRFSSLQAWFFVPFSCRYVIAPPVPAAVGDAPTSWFILARCALACVVTIASLVVSSCETNSLHPLVRSNDGATWAVVDYQTSITNWVAGTWQTFTVSQAYPSASAAWLYFRLVCNRWEQPTSCFCATNVGLCLVTSRLLPIPPLVVLPTPCL